MDPQSKPSKQKATKSSKSTSSANNVIIDRNQTFFARFRSGENDQPIMTLMKSGLRCNTTNLGSSQGNHVSAHVLLIQTLAVCDGAKLDEIPKRIGNMYDSLCLNNVQVKDLIQECKNIQSETTQKFDILKELKTSEEQKKIIDSALHEQQFSRINNVIELIADQLINDLNNMHNPPTAIPTERHKTPNMERAAIENLNEWDWNDDAQTTKVIDTWNRLFDYPYLSQVEKEDNRVFANDLEFFVKSFARHIILLFQAFRNKVSVLTKKRKEEMFNKFVDMVLERQGWLNFDFNKDLNQNHEDAYQGNREDLEKGIESAGDDEDDDNGPITRQKSKKLSDKKAAKKKDEDEDDEEQKLEDDDEEQQSPSKLSSDNDDEDDDLKSFGFVNQKLTKNIFLQFLNHHASLKFGNKAQDKLELYDGEQLYKNLKKAAQIPKGNKVDQKCIDNVKKYLVYFPALTIDSDMNTFLHYAALAGSKAIAQCLIEAQNPLTPKNNKGNTPLHFAASAGKQQIIELLLNSGCKPSKENAAKEDPFLYAWRNSDKPNTKSLTELIKKRKRTISFCKALKYIMLHRDEQAIKWVFKKDLDYCKDEQKGSALLQLILYTQQPSKRDAEDDDWGVNFCKNLKKAIGYSDFLSYLMVLDENEKSVLHYAAKIKSSDLVAAFLSELEEKDAKALLDKKDKGEMNPLRRALGQEAKSEKFEVSLALIKHYGKSSEERLQYLESIKDQLNTDNLKNGHKKLKELVQKLK